MWSNHERHSLVGTIIPVTIEIFVERVKIILRTVRTIACEGILSLFWNSGVDHLEICNQLWAEANNGLRIKKSMIWWGQAKWAEYCLKWRNSMRRTKVTVLLYGRFDLQSDETNSFCNTFSKWWSCFFRNCAVKFQNYFSRYTFNWVQCSIQYLSLTPYRKQLIL